MRFSLLSIQIKAERRPDVHIPMDRFEMSSKRANSADLVICRKAATAPSVASTGLGFPGAYQSRARSFMAEATFKRFQKVVAGLRRCCPAGFPVIIRTGGLGPNIEGTCTRRRNRFVITISERLDEKTGIEVLLHEWAHAICWTHRLDAIAKAPPEDTNALERISHGAEWGVAYGLVWRTFTTKILPVIQ